jgi:DNA-cytosine methyltransferase
MKLTHKQLKEGITVISLFDGMACGLVALKRAGIKVKAYYASEIDKAAIQVAKKNHPEIIHIGDITKVYIIRGILYAENGSYPLNKADLVIGGSPCQGFSFAGKQLNFDDPRSKLFFDFVRIYKESQPDFFLLENVKMKKESQDVISQHLGVEPEPINSRLFSAQNRQRLYWTNIPFNKSYTDKGILLQDILQQPAEIEPKYLHTETAIEYMNRTAPDGRSKWAFHFHSDTANNKSACLVANFPKGVPNNVLIVREATKKGYLAVKDGQCVDLSHPNSTTRRGRLMDSKSNCLTTATVDFRQFKDGVVRKFTPIECERLQTIPDNYTEGVSNSQRYRMLGNGWTADVIAHIFSGMLPATKPAFILTYKGASLKLSGEQQEALNAFVASLGKLKLTVKV